jgi:hypothetical protein
MFPTLNCHLSLPVFSLFPHFSSSMVGVSGMPDGPVQSTIDRLRFTLDIKTSMPVKRNPASRCLNRFEHEDAVVVDGRGLSRAA